MQVLQARVVRDGAATLVPATEVVPGDIVQLGAGNDAAALKQADIGVAMGSGSEVTKQAARMVLTDDDFGPLVHAVEIGRRVYDKIVSYVRYQMTQLLCLVLLFLAATLFDIDQGTAMTPSMASSCSSSPRRAVWSSSRWTPEIPTSCTDRLATPGYPSPTGRLS